MNEFEISKALKDSLSSSVLELGIDSADATLDVVASLQGLTGIPIFALLKEFSNVGIAIRDRNFAKNVVCFLNTLNYGVVDKEEINKHIDKLSSNEKKMTREMDLIATLLDKFTKTRKAEILANLYKNYIKGYMQWGDLDYFSVILESFNVFDELYLRSIYDSNLEIIPNKGWSEAALARFESIGLIVKYKKHSKNVIGRLSAEGTMFYELGILGQPFHYKLVPFYWHNDSVEKEEEYV